MNRLENFSQEDFKIFHDKAGIGIGVYDSSGNIISYNEVAAKHLGGKPEDFNGKNILDIFPTEEAKKYIKRIDKTLKEENPIEFEDNIKLGSTYQWFYSIYSKVYVNGNNPLVQIISQDITQIKNRELLYKANEKQFKAIFELAGVMMIYLDNNGNIIDINNKGCKILNCKKGECIGKSWVKNFIPNHLRKNNEQGIQKILKEQIKAPYYQESFIRDKKGNEILMAWNYTTIKDSIGQVIGLLASGEDITERKQKEVYKSQLASIVEFSEDGIESMDIDGNILSWNKGAEKIYGYKASEIIGKNAITLYSDDHKKELKQNLQKIKEEKPVCNLITKRKRKNGDIIDVAITFSPLKNSDDQIIGVSVITRDITEQTKTRKALKESELKYEIIFEESGNAIFIMSKDKIISCNKYLTQLFGYSKEEIIGRSPIYFSPEYQFEDVTSEKLGTEYIKNAFEQGYVSFEWKHMNSKGEIIDSYISLKKIEIEGKAYLISILHDLTKIYEYQKKLKEKGEEILAQNEEYQSLNEELNETNERLKIINKHIELSENKFRTAFNISPDAVNINRLSDGLFINVNDGFTRLTGYTESDIKNKTSKDIDIWAIPEDRQKLVNVLQKKGFISNYETMFRRKDGSLTTALMSASIIDLNNEKCILSITRDISDRKQLEEDLKISERRFRQLVEETHAISWEYDILNDAWTYVSPQSKAILDYRPEEWTNLDFWIQNLHPEDSTWAVKYCLECTNNGENHTLEYRFKTKNGEYVWLKDVVSVEMKDNKPAILRGVMIDITESKHAEEQIRGLSKGIEQSPAICVITDLEGVIEYVNPKFTELTGYSAQEAIGQNPRILKSNYHSKEFYKELWDTIKSGNDFHCEMRNKKKNGELYWESALISPIKDENGIITNFIALKEDITEKKKSEEQIKELNFRISLANDAAQIGVWDLDLLNNKMYWDENMFKLYGVDRSSVEESYELWQRALHPDDKQRAIYEFENALKTKDGFHTVFRIIWPNKKVRHIQAHAQIIFNANGEAVRSTGVNWDITKSVERENELRIKDFAIQSSLSAIGFADLDGYLFYVNKAYLKLWGYKDESEILGKHVSESGTLKSLDKEISSILSKGQSYFGEAIAIRKDGSSFYSEVSANLIKTKEGKPLYIMASFVDISEKKKAEEELKNSLIRNEAILNANPDLMFVFSDSGVILDYKSDNLRDLYLEPEKFIGKNIRDVLPPDIASLTLEKIEEVKRLNKVIEYGYSLTMEGKLKYYESRLVAYGNDKFLAIVRDISKSKSDELKIRESEQKLKDAQRIAKLGSWEFDHIQNKLEFSEEANHIFENDKEDSDILENLTFKNLLQFVYPDDREWVKEVFLDSLKGKYPYEIKHRIITQNGNLKYVKEKYRTTFDKQGNPIKTTGIILDITDLKKTELDLIKAKEKAEESDRLKSSFLANMSHEIRTPMNAIRGFAQLLTESEFPKEKQKRFLNIINSRSQDLLIIIDDIIDISKIEANQLNILETEFSLNKLLMEVYSNKEAEIGNDINLKLKLQLKSGLPSGKSFIIADESRLKQVLLNLLNNAVKFTEKGFIELGYYINDRSDLEFYVKDTGIGIPEHLQKLIFERFRQADDSSTRKYGGTGLGLHICKQILKLMGGEIWVESELGKGSTFFFTLPCKLVDKKEIPTQEHLKYNWANREVLIVEDDPINLYYLSELLAPTNITIHKTVEGKASLDLIKSNNNLHLILLDINLPGENGNEVFKQIRQINKSVPVIAQSAYSMAKEIKKSLEYGFNDYITKPIDSNLLFSIMNKYLSE